MKKLLLASAVAALSVTAANAAPTVYGKAFLTLDYEDIDSEASRVVEIEGDPDVAAPVKADIEDSGTELNSKSSRIGFKGSEALTADTDVVYKLEYQIDVDGDGDVFKQRDTYLGLANEQYGTLVAGRLTTIDDYVDFADVLEGYNTAKAAGPSFDEPRANNAFAYMSPDYDGVQFLAMYAFDNDQDSGGLTDDDQYGIGATYTTGPVNIGASYIGYGDVGHARLSGNYEVSPELTIGAMYQLSDYDTDDDENSFVLSGEMATASPWSMYAQVNMTDNVGGFSDHETLGVGVGGKYKFTKAATGHLYAGYLDFEGAQDEYEVEIDGETAYVTDSDIEGDGFGIGAGLEYKF